MESTLLALLHTPTLRAFVSSYDRQLPHENHPGVAEPQAAS